MKKFTDMEKFRVTLLAKSAISQLADLLDLLKEEQQSDEEKIPDIASAVIMLTGIIKRIDEILLPVQVEAQSFSPPWRKFGQHELN